jgi:uncharacterized membrane protein
MFMMMREKRTLIHCWGEYMTFLVYFVFVYNAPYEVKCAIYHLRHNVSAQKVLNLQQFISSMFGLVMANLYYYNSYDVGTYHARVGYSACLERQVRS